MSGYKGQHYTPSKIPGTDVWNPTTVNYALEMMTSEIRRLAAGLFVPFYSAENALAAVHWVTDSDWPGSKVHTPSLAMEVVDRLEQMHHVGLGTRLEKEIQTSGASPVDVFWSALRPRVYTWIVEFTLAEKNEFPGLDLMTQLEELVDGVNMTIYEVGIQAHIDVPFRPWWRANHYGVKMLRGRVAYRGVPRWFGDEVTTGPLIQEVSLALRNLPAYADHEVEEDMR